MESEQQNQKQQEMLRTEGSIETPVDDLRKKPFTILERDLNRDFCRSESKCATLRTGKKM